MNKVFLVGNLAADPVSKVIANGSNLATINLAVNDMRNRMETYFFPCVAWTNQATFISTYLKKGDTVAVDGRLTRRSYVTKDGKTAYSTEINIENIKIIKHSQNNRIDTTEEMVSINESFSDKISNITPDTKKEKKESTTSNDELDWINEMEE